jgi:hypothetical protein
MFFRDPYLGLSSRELRVLSPLWIAAWVMVQGLVGCTHKAKTRLTEVEVAKPVRTDVPIYSEWKPTEKWAYPRLALSERGSTTKTYNGFHKRPFP